jgi:trans-2,3-dihydro-3-hydroxyanthranilate isomerase
MAHRITIVDVFAEERYAGNQLAVVTGADDLSPDAMQRIARETNFSETTFVLGKAARAGAWDVRIFTPTVELPFAGHPTLGTAWVLRHEVETGGPGQIVLRLGVGEVPVSFAEADGNEVAWLRAPRVELGPTHPPEAVARVLDLTPDEIDPDFPVQEVSPGFALTFVPLRERASLVRARVRVERLEGQAFPPIFYLFCREARSSANQASSRMFAPTAGVPEDPATGSACAGLGAYALEHAYFGQGPVDVRIEQGYEIQRPSLLRLRARQEADASCVDVGGRVIASLRGELI